MLVRLKAAATVLLPNIGEHWCPAGSEVEIPDDHFDEALHEEVVAPPPPPVPEPAAEVESPAAESPADAPAEENQS
jgi:hypothetical protein